MRRRKFISLFSGAAAWASVATAQQLGKVYRIGVLETIPAEPNAANFDAFRQGLRELGYIEGQNLVIEYRSADGRGERFPELATELLRLKVDLILTRGTPAVLAAKNATALIPVVMAALGDPFLVVPSLAHPGGNVTGLSAFTLELEAKRVELLKDMIPGLSRLAALFNMSNPVHPPQWNEVQRAAQTLGLTSQLLDVRKREDIEPALRSAKTQHADALFVNIDAVVQVNQKLIVDLAAQHRLPAVYASREFAEDGGLVALGPSYPDLYRRAATYVDKIFKGEKPGDLPIEQPTKFQLTVNLNTAKALGLAVPPSILARADEVIE